jgi:hypothetical protein
MVTLKTKTEYLLMFIEMEILSLRVLFKEETGIELKTFLGWVKIG